MRKMVLVLLLLAISAAGWADEYVLVMSKEDNVCQQMVGVYNEDLRKYGEVKYDTHGEFNWIKWEEKKIRMWPEEVEGTNIKITIFDINNDLKDEVIVYTEYKQVLHHGRPEHS